MKKILSLLLAAFLLSPAALAQDRPIANQSTTVPRSAVVYGPTGANATDVTELNGLPTKLPDVVPIPTSPAAASNAVLFTADTANFRGVGFSLSGNLVGALVSECSNDNAVYVACAVMDSNTNSYTSGPATVGRPYYFPAISRYVRLRIGTYTSGSVSSIAMLRQTALDPGNVTIANAIGTIRQTYWSDQTNSVAVSGTTLYGGSRDTGQGSSGQSPWAFFSCYALPSAASTGALLQSYGSNDNFTSSYLTASQPAEAAGIPATTNVRVFFRYHRCGYVPGATPDRVTMASQFGG